MDVQENSTVSLWDASAVEPEIADPMDGDVVTDVAIVGGGFTGLSTALHLGERGVECHVLEARKIGFGGSGRNVGLVNAGLWLPPQEVHRRLGEKRGADLIKTLGEAPDYVFSLIERHQIQCEATRTGTIHAAHSPRGYRDLARRAEAWQRLGAPVALLNRDEAAEKIGSDAFYGGLLDRRAGTINPMDFVRGLARAAIGAKARVHAGVTVKSLRPDGGKWILETAGGTFTANRVVLGTNAYTDDLWPGLKRTFTPIHYFQLASEPLGERAMAILKEGQGLWDTGPIMFSLRRDGFGRILIGSMGKVIGGENGLSRRWASHRLRRLFPALGPVAWQSSWHGKIAMTPDHLPRIHRLADGLYTPIGYNGRGITTGVIFGRAMADMLAGGGEDDMPLAFSDPRPLASAPVMSRLYETAFKANQLFRSIWR